MFTDEYERLPQSEMQSLLERIDFHVEKDKTLNRRIDCFAAQGDQYYAIGFYSGLLENTSAITVYNGEGEYLYSVLFDISGTFDIAWSNDNNLLVYFYRSDYILEITTDGQCRTLFNAGKWETIDPLSHFKGRINAIGRAKTFEDSGYSFRVNQTTVERTNPDGTSVLLYKAPTIFQWTPIISVVLFFVIFFSILSKKIRKRETA